MVAVRRAEPDGLAEDRRIAVERAWSRSGGSGPRRPPRSARRRAVEQAAEHRAQAHHLEVGAADDAGAN